MYNRALSNKDSNFNEREVGPRLFRSKPVGDVCLDIAKFAEDRDCRTLEYLLKLAATEAYECLDEPIDPPKRLNSFGIWDWDVATDRICADATTARLFGVNPEKCLKGIDRSHFAASVYPDDIPAYSLAMSVAVTSEKEYEARYRVNSNGNLVWIYAKGTCLLSRDTTPMRFLGALIEL